MIKQTHEQRIENCLVAMAMVEDLPAEKFTPDLGHWANNSMRHMGPHNCGSTACFGGWVAVTPYFQRKGILPAMSGMPCWRGEPTSSMYLGQELFGDKHIFDSVQFPRVHSERHENERATVLHRLRNAVEELLLQEAA